MDKEINNVKTFSLEGCPTLSFNYIRDICEYRLTTSITDVKDGKVEFITAHYGEKAESFDETPPNKIVPHLVSKINEMLKVVCEDYINRRIEDASDNG